MAGLRGSEVDFGTSVTCGRRNGHEARMGVPEARVACRAMRENSGKNLGLTCDTASVRGLQNGEQHFLFKSGACGSHALSVLELVLLIVQVSQW